MKSKKVTRKSNWKIAVNRYFLRRWVLWPFIICMIPTVYLVQKITEFGAIYYGHGPDVWENGVRLVHLTARELSDGTQLTMAEHAIRIFAISLISLLAFAFWMFIFTYLNMKLHGVSFSRMSQNDSIRKGEE